ncbi:MAG: hypothetical protein KF850_12035 [Labilithrix sp.]|nr:hypothetical protein [Labilithrix sp.]MBX3212757.1 hypothetical protein [Labilithrix sp.]
MLLTSLVAAGGIAIACSSSDVILGASPDTGSDAAPPPVEDAGLDGSRPPFEGAPLPVTCASEPCAVSVVTTHGSDLNVRSEGYCALLSDKTVACWGANGDGQLGRGPSYVYDSATPARVGGLSDVVELEHTCAVTAAGDVFCWGAGPFLQDPEDTAAITKTASPVKLPLPPVAHIGIGHDVGCAALADGRVLCWGSNESGQLAPTWEDPPSASEPIAREVPDGAPVRRVMVGTTTFLLREDGTVVSWGANPPLGRSSSLFPDPTPRPMDVANVTGLDLTHDNACMAAGGVVHCWGVPVYPGIPATPLDRAQPEAAFTPEPVVDVGTTRTFLERWATIPYRWCAVAHHGNVYCYGANESGQVGDGSLDEAIEATQVADLPAPASRVKVTTSSSCALLTDGTVRCWGANYFGQLGNGQNRGRSLVPVEVILP